MKCFGNDATINQKMPMEKLLAIHNAWQMLLGNLAKCYELGKI